VDTEAAGVAVAVPSADSRAEDVLEVIEVGDTSAVRVSTFDANADAVATDEADSVTETLLESDDRAEPLEHAVTDVDGVGVGDATEVALRKEDTDVEAENDADGDSDRDGSGVLVCFPEFDELSDAESERVPTAVRDREDVAVWHMVGVVVETDDAVAPVDRVAETLGSTETEFASDSVARDEREAVRRPLTDGSEEPVLRELPMGEREPEVDSLRVEVADTDASKVRRGEPDGAALFSELALLTSLTLDETLREASFSDGVQRADTDCEAVAFKDSFGETEVVAVTPDVAVNDAGALSDADPRAERDGDALSLSEMAADGDTVGDAPPLAVADVVSEADCEFVSLPHPLAVAIGVDAPLFDNIEVEVDEETMDCDRDPLVVKDDDTDADVEGQRV
jgi:hypothetical protein